MKRSQGVFNGKQLSIGLGLAFGISNDSNKVLSVCLVFIFILVE